MLAGAAAVAVAAAAGGEHGEAGGVGVAIAAGGAPPVTEKVDGEVRRVVGVADDGAGVGLHVLAAVGHGKAAGVGAEVVIVDEGGLAFLGGAGVLRVADHLFVRGDAD